MLNELMNEGISDGMPQHLQQHDRFYFCTKDNMDECIAYLNTEMMSLCFPSVYNSENDIDLTSLVNYCFELLQMHQRDVRIREELETRTSRTFSDYNHLQSVQIRLKEDIERLEREIAMKHEQERQASVRNKNLNGMIKTERDKIRRLNSAIHHCDLQLKHELKKKEREINKLKEKLNQLIMERSHDQINGLNILNTVKRIDGKRGSWNHVKARPEEELYQLMIKNYEEKQKEILIENAELRESLCNLQKHLSNLWKQHMDDLKSSELCIEPIESNSDNDDEEERECIMSVDSNELQVSEDIYQLPFDVVKGDVERKFKGLCSLIQIQLKKSCVQDSCMLPADKSSPLKQSFDKSMILNGEEEMHRLQQELEEYKVVVDHQEEMIQTFLNSENNPQQEYSFLDDSQFLEEKESLAAQKKLFYEEKANFEEERKRFTEATIRLSHEKRLFMAEKVKSLRDQFSEITPFTRESSAISSPCTGSRMLPSTPMPMFTPSPKDKSKLPSTVELYKMLGLSTKSLQQSPLMNLPKAASLDSIVQLTHNLLSSSSQSLPATLTHQSAATARASLSSTEHRPQC